MLAYLLAYTFALPIFFILVDWHAKRVATRDAREANQFLRDMGAPTGLKVVKPRA